MLSLDQGHQESRLNWELNISKKRKNVKIDLFGCRRELSYRVLDE